MVRKDGGTIFRLGKWKSGVANGKAPMRDRRHWQPPPYRVLLDDHEPGDPSVPELEAAAAAIAAETKDPRGFDQQFPGPGLLAVGLIQSAVRRILFASASRPAPALVRGGGRCTTASTARRWLESKTPPGGITFDDCCSLLESEPDRLRQRVLQQLEPGPALDPAPRVRRGRRHHPRRRRLRADPAVDRQEHDLDRPEIQYGQHGVDRRLRQGDKTDHGSHGQH